MTVTGQNLELQHKSSSMSIQLELFTIIRVPRLPTCYLMHSNSCGRYSKTLCNNEIGTTDSFIPLFKVSPASKSVAAAMYEGLYLEKQ